MLSIGHVDVFMIRYNLVVVDSDPLYIIVFVSVVFNSLCFFVCDCTFCEFLSDVFVFPNGKDNKVDSVFVDVDTAEFGA